MEQTKKKQNKRTKRMQPLRGGGAASLSTEVRRQFLNVGANGLRFAVPSQPTVLCGLSIGGLTLDYFESALQSGSMPFLAERLGPGLGIGGALLEQVSSVFPCTTLCNELSMACGVSAESTGVIESVDYITEEARLKSNPLLYSSPRLFDCFANEMIQRKEQQQRHAGGEDGPSSFSPKLPYLKCLSLRVCRQSLSLDSPLQMMIDDHNSTHIKDTKEISKDETEEKLEHESMILSTLDDSNSDDHQSAFQLLFSESFQNILQRMDQDQTSEQHYNNNNNSLAVMLSIDPSVLTLWHRHNSDESITFMKKLDGFLKSLTHDIPQAKAVRFGVTSPHGSADKLTYEGTLNWLDLNYILNFELNPRPNDIEFIVQIVPVFERSLFFFSDITTMSSSSIDGGTSFARVYTMPRHESVSSQMIDEVELQVMKSLRMKRGVYTVLDRSNAVDSLDLPSDNSGDFIVCADTDCVFHSAESIARWPSSSNPLPKRGFGTLEDSTVPMLLSHEPSERFSQMLTRGKGRNYDLWSLLFNGFDEDLQDLCPRSAISQKSLDWPYIGK